MPDKKKYLVRTWSVPEERESVEVTYRQAMDMAKKVKRNADCTGENNPSFKRVKREVEAVDHWIQAMQSPDWLSSEYVVGPIRSSNPGRGDDTAEMTVNGDEADDQLVFDDFGYDDYGGCEYQCDENAPPNVIQGGIVDGNSGDTVAPPSPEESRAAGLDFGHRIDLDGVKSDWLDRVTQQYTGKPVTHILDAVKDIIQGGGSLESIKTCFDSLAKAFSQAIPEDLLPNLFPTGRELEQLWRRAENTYKSCWTCPNDHDHTQDKSTPCPQCGKPRRKLVKTTSIKDALHRKSQSPDFFDALKHGPSLYKSFKEQEPDDDTSFWSFWHGEGVRRLEEKGCDLTMTDSYLPIVVGLFIDGWKPCDNDYSIGSITLRVYNLPGNMATKKTCLIPLCHVDGPGKWKRPMLHLGPIVDELLQLGADGFPILNPVTQETVTAKVFLATLSIDHREQRGVLGAQEVSSSNVNPCVKCTLRAEWSEQARAMVCPATDGCGRKWVHRDGDLLRSELKCHFSSDAQTRSHMSNWEELSPLHKLPYFCFVDCVLTCSMHSIANVGKHLLSDVQGPASMKNDPRNARLMRSVNHIRSDAGQSLKEKFWPGETAVTNSRSPWSVTPEQFPLILCNLWSTRPPTNFSGVLTQYFKPRNPEECAAFPKPMRSPKMADRKDVLISGIQSTSMFLGGVDDRVIHAWSRIGAAVRKLDRRIHTRRELNALESEMVDALKEVEQVSLPHVMRHCLHQVTYHLPRQVRLWGCLREHASYAYEALHSFFIAMILKRSDPVASITSRLEKIQLIDTIQNIIVRDEQGDRPMEDEEEALTEQAAADGPNITPLAVYRGKPVTINSQNSRIDPSSNEGKRLQRLLRAKYAPIWTGQDWNRLVSGGSHVGVDHRASCFVHPKSCLRISVCDGVWLDDVKIQPAKRQTRTDNSFVLFREEDLHGWSTPYLGKVTGIYQIQGSPDGTFSSSDQHRWTELYLNVSRLPLAQLDTAAKNAGLHLYDMYACDPRGQATDELIPIENVVEQVFLGIDPRRGQEGEASSYFLQSKGHLHGRTVVTKGVNNYGN